VTDKRGTSKGLLVERKRQLRMAGYFTNKIQDLLRKRWTRSHRKNEQPPTRC
jgi:hypothetical protein